MHLIQKLVQFQKKNNFCSPFNPTKAVLKMLRIICWKDLSSFQTFSNLALIIFLLFTSGASTSPSLSSEIMFTWSCYWYSKIGCCGFPYLFSLSFSLSYPIKCVFSFTSQHHTTSVSLASNFAVMIRACISFLYSPSY